MGKSRASENLIAQRLAIRYVLRVQDERPTEPPTQADFDAMSFEARIAEVGESRARWDRLIDILAEREAAE